MPVIDVSSKVALILAVSVVMWLLPQGRQCYYRSHFVELDLERLGLMSFIVVIVVVLSSLLLTDTCISGQSKNG